MFYEPEKGDHGLPFNPYKSIVVPRPIGWITTLSAEGVVNLAPYSQFNNAGYDPPYVLFSGNSWPGTGERKHSVRNATDTGEFVVNMATWELRTEIDETASFFARGVDEAQKSGLEMIPSRIVKPPRVARSPVHLECKLHSVIALPGNSPDQVHHVVIGRVVGVHIRDDVIGADGKIDILKIRPLARLGYHDYTTVDSLFPIVPKGAGRRAGLEGKPGRRQKPGEEE